MMRSFIDEHKAFFAIVSIAAMLHIGMFFALKELSIRNPNALQASYPVGGGGFDSVQYSTLAENLVYHGTFSLSTGPEATPEAFRTPAYPLLVGLIKYVTGTFDAVPPVHILILILAAFCFYMTAIVQFPRYKTAALIAVALFMVDPVSIYTTLVITTENLYALALILSVYLLAQKTLRADVAFALSGASLGVSALVRPSGIYMAIPMVLWMAWSYFASTDATARRAVLKRVALFCLATIVVVAPWYVRNGRATGMYALSSLESYNPFNFNVPLYLSYQSGYKKTVEDVRSEFHAKAGGLTDDQQMELRYSPILKAVTWEALRPHLFGYAAFHLAKTANFFWSPSLKLELTHLRGFWEGQPQESWHPETSLINSIVDGNLKGVAAWAYDNVLYLPESIFLFLMSAFGLYWCIRSRSSFAWLVFGLVIFMGLLTSPISNPRYRVPVSPFMYLAGIAGVCLFIEGRRAKAKTT